MFKPTKVFSSFSSNDIQKAKDFYCNVLGLKVTGEERGNIRVDISDNSSVLIYPKADHIPATFTVLNFQVESVEDAVDELIGKGVKMEIYNEPDFETDAKGICKKDGLSAAWFKDPAGNILSVLNEE